MKTFILSSLYSLLLLFTLTLLMTNIGSWLWPSELGYVLLGIILIWTFAAFAIFNRKGITNKQIFLILLSLVLVGGGYFLHGYYEQFTNWVRVN